MLAEVEAELQRLAPDRRARDAEGLVDLVRLLGPLSTDEVRERARRRRRRSPSCARRARRRRGGSSRCGWPAVERWAVVEDVGRLRDGLGVPVPPGTPDVFAEPVEDPLADLVARFARTHGPFTTAEVADRLGLGAAVARHTLQRLARAGSGPRRRVPTRRRPAPSGATPRSCASCGAARWPGCARRSSPSSRPPWPGSSAPGSTSAGQACAGVDGVVSVIDQLAGCPVPASALEPLVLASRVRDYEPSYLDELTAAGEVIWAGHGALPGADGWVSLHLADQAPLTLPEPRSRSTPPSCTDAVLDALEPGGAWFFRQLADAVRVGARPAVRSPTRPSAPRCGSWSGRAASATTPSPRCGR